MNTKQNFKLKASLLGLAVLTLVFSSCEKEDTAHSASVNTNNSSKRNITDKRIKDKMMEFVSEIPALAVYNSTIDKVIVFDPNNAKDGFSFSSPNDGWNFSNSSGVQFVENPAGGGILFLGPGSFGSNSGGGGGIVVAGNTALNINYTFCFSASDDALNLDFFSLDQDFDGLSSVIGIAGDFEALASGDIDEDADFTDFFQGIAAYYVYDDQASGTYDIVDWFDSTGEELNFGNEGFAYVFDFQTFSVYFSSAGNINVSGGTMTFNGEYFAILNLFDQFIGDDEGEEVEEPEFVIVGGYGSMGCD